MTLNHQWYCFLQIRAFYTSIHFISWTYFHIVYTALSFVKWRCIFPYGSCGPQLSAAVYIPEELNDRQEGIFCGTFFWTKPEHLWAPHWNMKCFFGCWSPWSRTLWRWPSVGHSCSSFPGHLCSVQFSASFITPTLSCKVIGHIEYLAANPSLTYNMQMLCIWCLLCSCCFFEAPQPISLDWRRCLGVKD